MTLSEIKAALDQLPLAEQQMLLEYLRKLTVSREMVSDIAVSCGVTSDELAGVSEEIRRLSEQGLTFSQIVELALKNKAP